MSEETFQSSREAYTWCVENGYITQRTAEVLAALSDAGTPMNQTMTHQAIIRATKRVGLEKYSISPRFAVLERMGLIREVGRGPCPISRRSTVFYEATRTKPTINESAAEKLRSSKESLASMKNKIRELEEANEKLCELLNMRSASFKDREARLSRGPVEVQTSFC